VHHRFPATHDADGSAVQPCKTKADPVTSCASHSQTGEFAGHLES
jgi:hypothetical protein